MNNLKSLRKDTKERFDSLEKSLIDFYIGFLREVAKNYIQQGKRVFFKENRIVHWGEYNFGQLLIESDDDTYEIFDEYISEIRFELEINEKKIRGYIEIKLENLEDIKYNS